MKRTGQQQGQLKEILISRKQLLAGPHSLQQDCSQGHTGNTRLLFGLEIVDIQP